MIDAAEMDHLMKLARLHLTEDERARVQGDLNRILGYFEQLSELDTDGVSEMQRPVDLVNVMRDDTPGEVLPLDTVLRLAVEQEDDFLRIPRTVEQ